MAKAFLGFQNKTIVGKNDTVVPNSNSKTPQQNLTVYEYIQNPIPPSSSPLSQPIIDDLNTITLNTRLVKVDATKYEIIKNKEVPVDIGVESITFELFRSTEQQTENAILRRVWVCYNFDGDVVSGQPYYRACSYGGESASFTWFDFVNGEGAAFEGYNPAGSGQVHPWSVRGWYTWGARNFELHSPFGRPVVPSVNPLYQNYENLSYQADSFLCARDGWSDLGILWGYPMAWLTADFVKVWKALTTGKQGELSNTQWQHLTQWFDPTDPIKVLSYNGTISRMEEEVENQYPRWNRLFAENYQGALQRLKNSVQPFLDAHMSIGLDALSTCPGEIPGQFISTSLLSSDAQQGWWEFFVWLKDQVGLSRLYCEAQPHKKTVISSGRTISSPYLGMNIMSAEDWSYYPDATKHKYSELGKVKFMRNFRWGQLGPKTARYNINRSPARYSDLDAYAATGDDGDRRIPLFGGATYMGGLEHLHIFAARNLIDRFDQSGDTGINKTIPEFMLPYDALQVFPGSFVPAGQQRFIDRFPRANSFAIYLNNYTTPYLPLLGIDGPTLDIPE